MIRISLLSMFEQELSRHAIDRKSPSIIPLVPPGLGGIGCGLALEYSFPRFGIEQSHWRAFERSEEFKHFRLERILGINVRSGPDRLVLEFPLGPVSTLQELVSAHTTVTDGDHANASIFRDLG